MTFDELDTRLRVYETAHDHCVLPRLFIIVRLDGRGFTRLTREVYHFAAPFDPLFRDHMLATVQHLMNCGFRIVYGYTQSDEISLVLHRDEDAFQRKLRKLISLLAAEASACFSLRLGGIAAFDARISQLPDLSQVVDYLRWRQEDAHRNALNAHSYWLLRREGITAEAAATRLKGLSVAEKNELLFQQGGVNFNELPLWQKRGSGVYWGTYEKVGLQPLTQQPTATTRRRLKIDLELPMREEYGTFIQALMEREHPKLNAVATAGLIADCPHGERRFSPPDQANQTEH
jgi:tRNA(His) 5'-end guanylyltransferase